MQEVGLAVLEWQENGLVKSQNKLATFIAELQEQAPLHPTGALAGIPKYYIDPTIIAECAPYCTTTDDIPEKSLEAAEIPIDIEDGYPVVLGLPIWERLDGEKMGYYKLFREYRDMKYYNDTHLNQRAIAKLAENVSVPGKLLSTLSKIYHWAFRVKAYDKYKATELAMKKQRNAEELESKHAKFSNELLEQAVNYLKAHKEKLEPKVALDMVQVGMKYGRISAGLQGDKPGSHSSSAASHQTNIQIAQSATHNSVENSLSINANTPSADGNGGKDIQQQFTGGLKNTGTMASILHVLNKSGALRSATEQNIEKDGEGAEEQNEEREIEIC
jgi:hypothetical protein